MINYPIAAVLGGTGLLFGLAAFAPDAGTADRLYFVVIAAVVFVAALTVLEV